MIVETITPGGVKSIPNLKRMITDRVDVMDVMGAVSFSTRYSTQLWCDIL